MRTSSRPASLTLVRAHHSEFCFFFFISLKEKINRAMHTIRMYIHETINLGKFRQFFPTYTVGFLEHFLHNLDVIFDYIRIEGDLLERMLAYVPRARTRGHLFPRNPLHPTTIAREASPFSVLPFRSVSPPYFFCLLFHCALPSEGSYLAVRVYPGYKTAEANKWHRKRITPECRASAKYTRGSV